MPKKTIAMTDCAFQPKHSELKPYFWPFALLLTMMFFFFQTDFVGPDSPYYTATLDSIVADGDMNIVNNLDQNINNRSCGEVLRGLQVTKAYNFSDFHNSGSTVLWMPFYLYGLGLTKLEGWLFPGSRTAEYVNLIKLCSISYSSVAMGFLACLLIFIIASGFFTPGSAFWSTILIYWGTPFFYYTLVETGTANIPAMFMGVVILLATPGGLTKTDWRAGFLLGLLVAICVAVKIDLWFQIFMIFPAAIFFRLNGTLRPLNLIYVALGWLLGDIPRIINDYLKFGGFHSGEAGIINLRNSYHLQQLVSPYQGMFTSSPILIVCVLGLGGLLWRITTLPNRQKFLCGPDQAIWRIILALAVLLGAKLFIIGFRFAWGGGTFGARQLLTEIPCFVLLLNFLILQNKLLGNRWLRLILPAVLILTVILNLVYAGEFFFVEPMSYNLHPPPFYERIVHLRFLGMVLEKGFLQLHFKWSILPLYIFTLWLTWALLSRSRDINNLLAPWRGAVVESETRNKWWHFHYWQNGLTIYLCLSWIVVSGANFVSNQKNVKEMTKEGCFDFVTVIPQSQYELIENVNSMEDMIHLFLLKNDLQEVEHIRSVCRTVYHIELPIK